jgi:hypothetical protein
VVWIPDHFFFNFLINGNDMENSKEIIQEVEIIEEDQEINNDIAFGIGSEQLTLTEDQDVIWVDFV